MSINKVSKENSINFLETDYEKLDQEIKEIKAQHNKKEVLPTKVAKQTSGNLYKQKSLINFLEPNSIPSPEKMAEADFSPIKSKHLDKPNMNVAKGFSSQIISAQQKNITNTGGPNKYIKSQTSNSIFDPDNLSRLTKELNDNKENTLKDKANLATNRRLAEQQRMDDLANNLRNTDLRKDSQVMPIITNEGHTYKTPPISIFDDNKDFNRVPEKTYGENAIEEAKQERLASKKNPYIKSKKTSAQSLFDKFFDNLMEDKNK